MNGQTTNIYSLQEERLHKPTMHGFVIDACSDMLDLRFIRTWQLNEEEGKNS